MRFWLLIFSCYLILPCVRSQYFHESFDLHYNLRSSLIKDQKAKIGFKTYSNVHFENTIPNLMDNFQVISRFRFVNSTKGLVKNAEFGALLTANISGKAQIPEQYNKPPINIRIYSSSGNSNIFTPGLQYIKKWLFNDTLNKQFQIGISLRYNIVGNPELFTETYPWGYDVSLMLNHKLLSVQFMYSAHTIYNSFTFRSSEVSDIVETNRNRVSVPMEFENLTFLTIGLGDAYYKRPTEKDRLLHYLYFSLRRLCPSNKEVRPDFSFKNLDYIFGFKLQFKQILINPEYSTKRSDIEYLTLRANNYSILLGYEFKKISIKLGYAHIVYYELATAVSSLKNNDHIKLDKLIFSIEYSFL